jgi:fructose-1,6-bisphosphatase/inositol monophosphatase family enzyme
MATDTTRDPEHRFIEAFCVAARQAGSVARRLQAEISLRAKLGQATPEGAALTAVDLAAQDIILQLLHAVLPEAAVDAEEDTDTVQLFPPVEDGRPLIVVDPIDGTLNYARGSNDYAVMGALLKDGIYHASVVYFPTRHQLCWARRHHGCWQQTDGNHSRQIHVDNLPPRILVTPWVPESWRSDLQDVGFDVQVSRCSGIDASAPVIGDAIGAVSAGSLDRRRAIGLLLTLEAGGVVKVNGRDWQAEDPLRIPDPQSHMVVADSADTAARILRVIN